MGTGNTGLARFSERALAVHPRGHGEHFRQRKNCFSFRGSSPWARGTRFESCCWRNTSAVHPRGHGEHSMPPMKAHFEDGSSPWARGTHTGKVSFSASSRFIPVGTGNTILAPFILTLAPVHPRGHGEHSNDRQLIYKRNIEN